MVPLTPLTYTSAQLHKQTTASKLGRITQPAIAIRQKLTDLEITRVITYGKSMVIIGVFEFSSLHIHNRLLQFMIHV